MTRLTVGVVLGRRTVYGVRRERRERARRRESNAVANVGFQVPGSAREDQISCQLYPCSARTHAVSIIVQQDAVES